MKTLNLSLLILIISSILGSCSSAVSRREEYISAYHMGEMGSATQSITNLIDNEISPKKPYDSKNGGWLLLDRATIHFVGGDLPSAIEDYRQAIDILDFNSQSCMEEIVGQTLFQDDWEAYAGEDYEQVLARVYLALALLHEGDESNAYAILKQAETLQQNKIGKYQKTPGLEDYQLIENAIGKYLFATLLEKRGDLSNALILYRQAQQLTSHHQLYEDLNRIEKNNFKVSDKATLLILCHNGNVPYKISATSSASVASALALEFALGTQNIDPAWSSLTGIPVPCFTYRPDSIPLPTFATLEGHRKELLPFYEVGATALYQLKQKIPVIVARGVARFLLRRGAVAYANDRCGDAGALIDFAMFLANLSTKADTRSWSTLPDVIDLARYDVSAGEHLLSIKVNPVGMQPREYKYCLHLKKGDFCIINVFNIQPGFTSVQVPFRFLKTKKLEITYE